MATEPAPPARYYRLWCGSKRYTHWLDDEKQIWRIAIREGLAFEDRNGDAGLGPLTWIEVGERKYPRWRTVTVERRGLPRRAQPGNLDRIVPLVIAALFYGALIGPPLIEALN